MVDLSHNVKKYFAFSKEELRALFIGILILSFIFSFDKWGVDQFDFYYGLKNLFHAFLIVLLALLFQQSVQRIVGLAVGFKIEYRIWLYGLVIGLVLCVFSNGKLWFFAPGGIIAYHMAGHRLGSFRYGLNYWPLSMIAFAGSVSSIVLAVIFKLLLMISPENVLLQQAMVFNLWLAVFTMLPIPPLNGSHVFFASRHFYIFAFGLLLGLAASLYFLSVFMSLLLSVVLGGVIWFLYMYYVEATLPSS
jgi:Zn-dependent protease